MGELNDRELASIVWNNTNDTPFSELPESDKVDFVAKIVEQRGVKPAILEEKTNE